MTPVKKDDARTSNKVNPTTTKISLGHEYGDDRQPIYGVLKRLTGLGRAILNRALPPQKPNKSRANSKTHKEDVAHTDQQNIKCVDTRPRVDQSDGQREQDPADNIVTDACAQHDDSDRGPKQLQLREDAAEHGKSSYGHRDTDEEKEGPKGDGLNACIVSVGLVSICGRKKRTELLLELMIKPVSDRTTQPKGQRHSSSADAQCDSPIELENSHIDFQADEEKEQDQSQVGNQVEVCHGIVVGEYRI
jgi:hypothetical protein